MPLQPPLECCEGGGEATDDFNVHCGLQFGLDRPIPLEVKLCLPLATDAFASEESPCQLSLGVIKGEAVELLEVHSLFGTASHLDRGGMVTMG